MKYVIVKHDLSDWPVVVEVRPEQSLNNALKYFLHEIEDSIHYEERIIISLSQVKDDKMWFVQSSHSVIPIDAQPLIVWSLDETKADNDPLVCFYDQYCFKKSKKSIKP